MDGAVDNLMDNLVPRLPPGLPHRPPTSFPTTRCLDEQQQIFKIVFLKRYPANDCEGFVRSDDTTGQTGVSRT